ncbi:MAG TPA: outer membrane lipoprotein carrier protein LolA [bacterium]|nr:outer membrane lipoprotein carrier protein LolA [bacterium]
MTIRRIIPGLLIGLPVLLNANPSARVILRNVENALTSATTMEVHFSEIFFWEMTGESHTLQGHLKIKGESRFRIETDDQVLVSDGRTLWTYSRPNHRVLIDEIDPKDNSLLPRQILFRYTKDYRAVREADEAVGEVMCHRLVLTSAEASLIPQVRVWIDPKTWLPKRVEQTDLDGNRTLFDLRDLRVNEAFDDSLFLFEIPEGADVIDMRETGRSKRSGAGRHPSSNHKETA